MFYSIFIGVPLFLIACSFLLGFLRGFNRSILRIILVIISIVGAILLSHELSHILMGVTIDGQTIKEKMILMINEGDIALPQSMIDLFIAIIEIIIAIGTYFSIFYLLKFITWAIIFPIGKIFVKKGKARRLLGGVIGIVQGIVISFALMVPMSGLTYEVDKITKIQVDGHRLVEVEGIETLDGYADSPLRGFYSSIGDWYFNILTTVEIEEGKTVNISDVSDVVSSVVDLGNTAINIDEHMELMASEQSTPQDKLQAMKDLGEDFRHLEDSVNNMGEVSKDIINDVVPTIKEMFKSDDENVSSSLDAFFDDFDVEELDISAAGDAMYGIATFIEKTDPSFDNIQPVEKEEVEYIVDGISKNLYIIDLAIIDGEVPQILDVSGYEELFEQAISMTDVDDFHKNELRQLFGLPIA